MQFVLPIDPADVRALPVDPAALEVIIEMSAGAIATIEAGGFQQQMHAPATFPALVAGKVALVVIHWLAGSLGLALEQHGLHFAPSGRWKKLNEFPEVCC